MKSYLITNPNPKAYTGRIQDFLRLPRGGSGRREDVPDDMEVIDSREKLDRALEKSMFVTPSMTDTIFIVPELFWEGQSGINTGYRIAMELFEGKLKDSFFNLVFISFYRKDQLLKMVDKEFLGLVKSFPHLVLEDLRDSRTELPVPAYSKIHFELLKRIVISQSGRISYLIHTLSHLTETDYKSSMKSIGHILEMLSLPAYRGQDDEFKDSLDELKALAADAWTAQDIRNLTDRLNRYMARLEIAMAPPEESKPFGAAGRLNYRVLIIEDDPEYREWMREFFSERFLKVDAFDNRAIADGKVSIAKIANDYHLLIMDLLFTETGKDEDNLLPFNGLDLLGRLRLEEMGLSMRSISEKRRKEAVPKTTVRIVSAVPRNVISRLVERYLGGESPVVFTKGNGWEQLRGCLIDRMDEMIDDVRRNEEEYLRYQEIPAPDTGVFGNPGMRDAVLGNPEALSLAMEFARKVADREEKLDENAFSLISPRRVNDPKELLDHLNATLAHRRLVIKYINTQAKNSCFVEADYQDFLKDYVTDESIVLKFRNKERRYRKSYLTTKLGFNIKDDEQDPLAPYTCIIDMRDKGCFFDGELAPSQDKIHPNPQTRRWVKKASNYLEERAQANSTYWGALGQAGIMDYLVSDRSVEAFISMLEQVCGYLENEAENADSRADVQVLLAEVFEDFMGFSHDYSIHESFRQCSLVLLDRVKRIIEDESLFLT